jgi:hypothetical protein
MDIEKILSVITPEIINEKQKYSKLIFSNYLNSCFCINKFIIFNLYNILNKLYLFVYLNTSILNNTEINNLFSINKSKKAITLSLFNQEPNDKNYYNYGFDDNDYPLPSYRKKFITFFILKSSLQIFNEYIANLNMQNKYYNKPMINILTKEEVNTIVKNEKDDPILIYDDQHNPKCILDIINFNFTELNNLFRSHIQMDINSEYVGILMYEEAINTSTDIIKILHDSLGL